MFSLTSSHQYFLYKKPTDMRKSFDGLQGLIEGTLKRRATSGEVFVFINKRRDRMKLLHWQAGGFVLYYKRLEQGTFDLPDMKGQGGQIAWSELMMIIEGIRVKAFEKRARFALEKLKKQALK